MKAVFVLAALVAVFAVSSAQFTRKPFRPTMINRPTMPKQRFPREANPEKGHGSVTITQTKPLSGPERRPSYNIDYQHNIWQSKNGQITAGGGAQKLPGQRWEPVVGIQGRWRF